MKGTYGIVQDQQNFSRKLGHDCHLMSNQRHNFGT